MLEIGSSPLLCVCLEPNTAFEFPKTATEAVRGTSAFEFLKYRYLNAEDKVVI